MPGTLDLCDAALDSAEEAELVHYVNQAPNNIPDEDDLPTGDSAATDMVDAQLQDKREEMVIATMHAP